MKVNVYLYISIIWLNKFFRYFIALLSSCYSSTKIVVIRIGKDLQQKLWKTSASKVNFFTPCLQICKVEKICVENFGHDFCNEVNTVVFIINDTTCIYFSVKFIRTMKLNQELIRSTTSQTSIDNK